MPSYDLLTYFPEQMRQISDWQWDGRHYERTANAWLANMDSNRDRVLEAFRETYGPDEAKIWFQRWRIFFMACAELWGYAQGGEWVVGHYLLEKPEASRLAAA